MFWSLYTFFEVPLVCPKCMFYVSLHFTFIFTGFQPVHLPKMQCAYLNKFLKMFMAVKDFTADTSIILFILMLWVGN